MKLICTGLATLLLTASQLSAQPSIPGIPTTLNISLTATYQGADKTSGADQNITTSVTKTAKVTSAAILAALAKASGTPFPAGSYLAQDGSGTLEALTKSGTATSLNLTTGTLDFTGASVYSGSVDSDSGKQNETFTVNTVLTFDDGNGSSFTCSGLVKFTTTITAPDKNSNQKTTVTFSGTVSGAGNINAGGDLGSVPAVYTGTVAGTGTQTSGGVGSSGGGNAITSSQQDLQMAAQYELHTDAPPLPPPIADLINH